MFAPVIAAINAGIVAVEVFAGLIVAAVALVSVIDHAVDVVRKVAGGRKK